MSLPALLLRVLLALALVVNGTTGAAAAVHAHAATAADAAMASHGKGSDCHGDGTAPDAPAEPPAMPADDCAGCAAGGCDCACVSLAHVALPASMTGFSVAPRAAPASAPANTRAAPPSPDPIRPPIGQG
jgi:hypothetical protein